LSSFPEKKSDKIIGYSALKKYSDEETEALSIRDKLVFEQDATETIDKMQLKQ
jgi:hypothetical protein